MLVMALLGLGGCLAWSASSQSGSSGGFGGLKKLDAWQGGGPNRWAFFLPLLILMFLLSETPSSENMED